MKSNELIDILAFEGRINSELSCDYILPDTYPDVKKVLRVDAKPILVGRYISGKKLEFNGGVDYSVIFSADSEHGESLHCVHFAGDWDGSVGELDSLEHSNITITPKISACTQRLANPRKLSLKSTVSTYVKVTSPLPTAPECEGALNQAEEMELEKLTKSVPSRRERTFLADPLRISEDLEPDAAQPSIDEIVSCSAEICFHEAKINGEGDFTVSLKGEAIIDCIYKSAGEAGVYKSFSRKCPVAYIVGAEEYANHFENCRAESLFASADATTVEINASVGENAYGERRVVELDLTADVTVCIVGSEDTALVLDAYSVVRDCECVMREFECEGAGKVLFANFSVGETVNRSEANIPDGASVINAMADITTDSVVLEHGRAILSGTATVSCILEKDGEYISTNVAVPIKCELNAGEITEPFSYICRPTAYDMRARLDPERLCLDFEVSLCMQICPKHRRGAVSVIRLFGEEHEREAGASLTLCYPTADDTLWNIAKRYNTTVGALEAANSSSGRVLLIPRASKGIII